MVSENTPTCSRNGSISVRITNSPENDLALWMPVHDKLRRLGPPLAELLLVGEVSLPVNAGQSSA
jgi:hypothetical protein